MKALRKERINSVIQETIGKMIVTSEIKDPRVDASLSVTRAEINNDYTMAKVFVCSYSNPKTLQQGVAALNNAKGYIQGRLGKVMQTRNTPRLAFFEDNSFKINMQMDYLIKKALNPDTEE